MGCCTAGGVSTAHERFDAFLELAAREQDSAGTGGALETDVGAQPYDVPLVAATGMRLAQPHHIAEANLDAHAKHFTTGARLWQQTNRIIGTKGLTPLGSNTLGVLRSMNALCQPIGLCYNHATLSGRRMCPGPNDS